jgi:hypothetical protein
MTQTSNTSADSNATITGESLFSSGRRKMLLLTGASVFIVFWGTVALMFFFTKMSVKPIIALGVTQPRELSYKADPAVAEAALLRIQSFSKAALAGQNESLTLTLAELRAILINRPELKLCHGRLDPVKLDKNGIQCEFCMPLPEAWGEAAKGKFLDGQCLLLPRIDHGSLFLKLNTITVKNQALEGLVVQAIRETSLLSYLATPEQVPVLQSIKRLELADGSITIFSGEAK